MYASTLPRSNWLRRASIRLAWYRHMPASSWFKHLIYVHLCHLLPCGKLMMLTSSSKTVHQHECQTIEQLQHEAPKFIPPDIWSPSEFSWLPNMGRDVRLCILAASSRLGRPKACLSDTWNGLMLQSIADSAIYEWCKRQKSHLEHFLWHLGSSENLLSILLLIIL